MKIETHNIDDTKIAEVNSDETIINNTEDGLDWAAPKWWTLEVIVSVHNLAIYFLGDIIPKE